MPGPASRNPKESKRRAPRQTAPSPGPVLFASWWTPPRASVPRAVSKHFLTQAQALKPPAPHPHSPRAPTAPSAGLHMARLPRAAAVAPGLAARVAPRDSVRSLASASPTTESSPPPPPSATRYTATSSRTLTNHDHLHSSVDSLCSGRIPQRIIHLYVLSVAAC